MRQHTRYCKFLSLCHADDLTSSSSLNKEQACQQQQLAQHLQCQCQDVLSSCATSVETDQKLLQSQQGLTSRHAQAIRARLEHKQLIVAAIKLLVAYITAVSCTGQSVDAHDVPQRH